MSHNSALRKLSRLRIAFEFPALQSARTGSCSGTKNYAYDLNGNDTGQGTYDAQDRVTAWSYDANGDYAGSGGSTVAYDILGNLRYFAYPTDGIVTNYVADGNNRRVFRASTGSFQGSGADSRGWLYDGRRITGEIKSDGSLLSHFAYVAKTNAPDLMVRKNASNVWELYRILTDPIGTVEGVICMSSSCTAGSVVEGMPTSTVYNYNDDFGAIWNQPQYQPFGFAGGLVEYYQGTLLMGARDYHGWAHRWMAKDPIRFGGGLNFYAYCNNDPINCIDPTGLGGEGVAVEGAAAEGVVAWFLQTLAKLAIGEAAVGTAAVGAIAVAPFLVYPWNASATIPDPTIPAPVGPMSVPAPPMCMARPKKEKPCNCVCIMGPGQGPVMPPAIDKDKRIGGQYLYPDEASCHKACILDIGASKGLCK